MKKFNYLLVGALALTSVFSSCKKDEDGVEVDPVEMSFINVQVDGADTDGSSGSLTVDVDQEVSFDVVLKSNDVNLKSFNAKKGGTLIDVYTIEKTRHFADSKLDTISFSYVVTAKDAGTSIPFAFHLEDRKEMGVDKTMNLVVNAAAITISFVDPTDDTKSVADNATAGGTDEFKISVSSVVNIKSFAIDIYSSLSDDKPTSPTFTAPAGDAKTYSTTYTPKDTDNAGAFVVFTATDINGTEVAKVFSITSATMATEKTGQIIGNLHGPDQSNYDLVTSTRLAGSAVGDMQNTTSTSVYVSGWKSETATTFVKATGFDYTNASSASAKTAYEGGIASKVVAGPEVGDIYVANLRGQNVYAVIKITQSDDDVAGNNEVLKFDYKKD